MGYPKVAIVVVHYKNVEDTINCIKSILDNEYPFLYEIVVVENSRDYIGNYINEISCKVRIISMSENVGYAAGCNVGIKSIQVDSLDFVIVMNNDVILEKDCLCKIFCLGGMSWGKIGILTGRIYLYGGQEEIDWYNGGYISWWRGRPLHHLKELLKIKGYGQERMVAVDFISGCFMCINTDVFCKVGLLPEDYFMYFEDVDFCVQVRRAGFKLIYKPDAVVYHKWSATSGVESPFSVFYGARNRIVFNLKYNRNPMFYILFPVFFTRQILRFVCMRKWVLIPCLLKGVVEGLAAGIKGFKDNVHSN